MSSLHHQVIYCYGDLVPRHGELFEGKEESGNRLISIMIKIPTSGRNLVEIFKMKITIDRHQDRSHQVDDDQSSSVGC